MAEKDSVVPVIEEPIYRYVISDARVVLEPDTQTLEVLDLVVYVALVHLEVRDSVAQHASGRRPRLEHAN